MCVIKQLHVIPKDGALISPSLTIKHSSHSLAISLSFFLLKLFHFVKEMCPLLVV